jgi:hypothetical protein
MIDIPGTYQATFFSNNSDITPSADTIPIFLDLFRDKAFLPNTFQEIEITPAGPHPQTCLRLSPPDEEWGIEIGLNRIIFKKNAIKPKGSNMGRVEDFVKEVVDFCRRIQQRFPRKANRLSLLTDGLLREMQEERLQQIYTTFFQPVTFYTENPPVEWEFASVARVTMTINGSDEKLNVNTRIKRIRGRLAEPSGFMPFDRISLLFDINTFQLTREPRFGIEAVSDFFLKAAELRATLLKQMEEYLNA